MKFILGEKIGMSQIFDEKGKVIPVTLILAGPCTVVQVKTVENDKYDAVQLGFGRKKNLTKPLLGHLKKLGVFKYICEFRVEEPSKLKRGEKITVEDFKKGDVVAVSGVSKGKGFQGVVKRHKFSGGPASHGHRHVLRSGGSTGSRFPQHTRKGRKMAGRMGNDRVTFKKVKVIGIDQKNNVVALKGAVPGGARGLVEIVK
ncbi:MAG: hypothetical protein ACD_63C00108G0005 [uncultured bacterium]|nr:MAG: hypothetical protein ACD_63C00108G0005 [uncultured bacterium]